MGYSRLYAYCILCSVRINRKTCQSWGTHSCQPPLDRLKIYNISRYLRSPYPAQKCLPRTDTHHVMGPNACCLCSV